MKSVLPKFSVSTLSLAICASVSLPVHADEGGTSFWLPGQYSSLSAVPGDPGWSLPLIYYHATLDADGNAELPANGVVTLGLEVTEDLLVGFPTYVFETPVWGGQASLGVALVYGRADLTIDATLTEPGGEVISGGVSDSLTSFGDLYPTFSVKWNKGVHNYMAYAMAGVPVGSYEVDRLVNMGTNHWSVDLGGGYTYFNPDTGNEFSATLGATYNFENPDTNYKSGIDAHLGWGASKFVSESTHIGLVGYFFNQITGDSGAGANLGDFEARVTGVGPQIGHLFSMGAGDAYLNFKAYWEFNEKYRPAGWNVWALWSIPL